MAESTGKKGKKSRDSFVDDLDSMLNVEDAREPQVGLIDDDDAIDRLLVGDVFPDESPEDTPDEFGDIDQLIAVDEPIKSATMAEIDEFGDEDLDEIIAGLAINPQQPETAEELIAELPELDTAVPEVDLSELETVGEIDEFADETPGEISIEPPEPTAAPKIDEFAGMTEIDAFAGQPVAETADNADFLLADFNISAEDSVAPAASSIAAAPADETVAVESNAVPDVEMELDEAPSGAAAEEDEFAETMTLGNLESVAEPLIVDIEPDEMVADEPEAAAPPLQVVAPAAPPMDYGPQIAVLVEQFNELKKLQKQTHHDLQFKVDNEALTACLETVDTLQTEQKKTKRNLDGLVNKKPVGVYIANGVAGVSMLIAAGLGIEAMITKSQVSQLVEIIGQLKQQIESAPAADAADKALMSKQLDELSVAQGIAGNQIAELTKAIHGDAGAEKPMGDFGKQLSDLSNQDMQMGAAIEALQNKVTALEKGRGTAVAAAKPAPKKPVIEENWVVNLIAFKQDWYAKRKAEEFAGKGVPAKVSRADSKGEIWYRLSVDGFKSQYEAAAYAARVKKSLNLDSVWVAKNKN